MSYSVVANVPMLGTLLMYAAPSTNGDELGGINKSVSITATTPVSEFRRRLSVFVATRRIRMLLSACSVDGLKSKPNRWLPVKLYVPATTDGKPAPTGVSAALSMFTL